MTRPTSLVRWCSMFLCLLPALATAQPAPHSPRALAQAVDEVLNSPEFANAWWGALVVDLEHGTTLYQRHPSQSFVPASNAKLFTTAAALDLLGPDYRYETHLYVDGPVEDGVLRGNVIVRGSGDPVIGGRFNDGDRTEVFRIWARVLQEQGITHVEGDLIGDDDLFDETPLGTGWSWDDETYWYAAEVGALSFNDNNVDFRIRARRVGEPASVSWKPRTDYVRVINSTQTIPRGARLDEGYHRARGTNTITLSSRVPQGRVDTESLTVTNPTLFFMHVLREQLVRAGLSVQGRAVDVDELSIKPDYEQDEENGLRLVATHVSPPLADIVEVINKNSQNLYAEQVLRTLAVARPLEPTDDLPAGSAEMGIRVAMETFARAGIDTTRIALVDGSGLSPQNLVTPEAEIALLRYMWDHPEEAVREAFLNSLPVGGVDGSLKYRYPYGAARGNVRGKTGTIANASTLAGYVTTATGTPLAFVLLCNHYTTRRKYTRFAQDAIVTLLAGYQR